MKEWHESRWCDGGTAPTLKLAHPSVSFPLTGSAVRLGPFSQVGVLHPAKVGRILVASSRAGLEPHALVLVTAHDKAPARDDLARPQRWRGVQDDEVHPTLCRGPEILGQPVEQRGVGRSWERMATSTSLPGRAVPARSLYDLGPIDESRSSLDTRARGAYHPRVRRDVANRGAGMEQFQGVRGWD